jgi:Intrinsic membrane protein PufX
MMNEDFQNLTVSRKQVIYLWVLSQMARGAGLAAMAVIVLGLGLYALYGIGLLLPAESRETPAPMGAVTLPVTTAVV